MEGGTVRATATTTVLVNAQQGEASNDNSSGGYEHVLGQTVADTAAGVLSPVYSYDTASPAETLSVPLVRVYTRA